VDVSGKCPGFAAMPSFDNGAVDRNATLTKAIRERDAEIARRAAAGERPPWLTLKLKQFQIILFVRLRAPALRSRLMRRRPVETDFKVEVSEGTIVVRFLPTRSVFTFHRFMTSKDIAEFGPVSPDPIEQHASRHGGTRGYNAAEVRAMAFRLATREVAATSASGRPE
jgi:hypothetical protein